MNHYTFSCSALLVPVQSQPLQVAKKAEPVKEEKEKPVLKRWSSRDSPSRDVHESSKNEPHTLEEVGRRMAFVFTVLREWVCLFMKETRKLRVLLPSKNTPHAPHTYHTHTHTVSQGIQSTFGGKRETKKAGSRIRGKSRRTQALLIPYTYFCFRKTIGNSWV